MSTSTGPTELDCAQVLERLSDYLDGELSSSERESMETHLRTCPSCERFGGELISALKSLRTQVGSERAPHSVIARVHRALDGTQV